MATEKENLFWTIVSHSIFNRMPYKSSNIANLSCSVLEFFHFFNSRLFLLRKEKVCKETKRKRT